MLGDPPEFNFDVDSDGINDTWDTDLEGNQEQDAVDNSIIYNHHFFVQI